MKVKRHINQLIVIVLDHMVAICVKDDFLLAALVHQIDDANGLVELQLGVEMLCKGRLRFFVIWNEIGLGRVNKERAIWRRQVEQRAPRSILGGGRYLYPGWLQNTGTDPRIWKNDIWCSPNDRICSVST